jgi:hypothetical protein
VALLFPLPMIGLAVWWHLFHSWPALLEKRIRQGKSWIYVPLWWKGPRKVRARFLASLIRWLLVATVGASFWMALGGTWHTAAYSALIALVFHEVLRFRLHALRFRQQEDLYFARLTERLRRYDEQGHRATETEVRNLSSWEHQTALREAEGRGELLAVLTGKAELPRRDTPTGKIDYPRRDTPTGRNEAVSGEATSS